MPGFELNSKEKIDNFIDNLHQELESLIEVGYAVSTERKIQLLNGDIIPHPRKPTRIQRDFIVITVDPPTA